MSYLSFEEARDLLPDPVFIVEELNKDIIGQESAKKSLGILLFQRAVRKLQLYGEIECLCPLEKNNLLLLGKTGTGKTALIRAFEKIAGVPITIFDVSCISARGYIGLKVEDILNVHVQNCVEFFNKSLDTALPTGDVWWDNRIYKKEDILRDCVETGIIYLDEIDKLCMPSIEGVSDKMVQQELLKIVENGNVDLSGARSNMKTNGKITTVNTNNISFIAGGAFHGLDEIIRHRLRKDSSIGFHSAERVDLIKQDIYKHAVSDDLIKYGMQPELLGRLSRRSYMTDMTKDLLKKIFIEPRNSIYMQYKEMFRVVGIDLTIEDSAVDAIAGKAIKLEMGARALKEIVIESLNPYLYGILSLHDKNLTITESDIHD